MARLTLNPVVWGVNALSRWAWHQVLQVSGHGFQRWIFAPLSWPQPVLALYADSRDLAWALAGTATLLVILRSMWPSLSAHGRILTLPVYVERLVTAALLSAGGAWAVEMLAAINKAVVSELLPSAVHWQLTAAPTGLLSPLLVLASALAMLALMLYLGIFYAIRAVEIYVLTAALPWFALWWAMHEDSPALSTLGRELAAVIFVQAFQAGAFWLAIQLFTTTGDALVDFFLELALLWYMTKIPGQLRRLMGSRLGAGSAWR
jgi:hypothetical protein